jgi:hypothetical protein
VALHLRGRDFSFQRSIPLLVGVVGARIRCDVVAQAELH